MSIKNKQSDPFKEIFKPKAIVKLSKTALALTGVTLAACMPELSLIARTEGLNLNRRNDFLEAVRIMNMDKLSQR